MEVKREYLRDIEPDNSYEPTELYEDDTDLWHDNYNGFGNNDDE